MKEKPIDSLSARRNHSDSTLTIRAKKEEEWIIFHPLYRESSSQQIGKQTKGSEENHNDMAVSELNELKNLALLLNPFRKIVKSNIDYTSHNVVKTDGSNLITETDIDLMIKTLLPKISN